MGTIWRLLLVMAILIGVMNTGVLLVSNAPQAHWSLRAAFATIDLFVLGIFQILVWHAIFTGRSGSLRESAAVLRSRFMIALGLFVLPAFLLVGASLVVILVAFTRPSVVFALMSLAPSGVLGDPNSIVGFFQLVAMLGILPAVLIGGYLSMRLTPILPESISCDARKSMRAACSAAFTRTKGSALEALIASFFALFIGASLVQVLYGAAPSGSAYAILIDVIAKLNLVVVPGFVLKAYIDRLASRERSDEASS